MRKAVAAFILVFVCLFLGSVTWGTQVFSTSERRSQAESPMEKKDAPESMVLSESESRGKKIRLSMNAFDLANGLTFQEQEDLLLKPGHRLAAFLFLVASIWMAALMRKPRRHQL